MSNLENDFKTYAALAMTCPATLKQWMRQYPKIKAKTDILVAFYTLLDSEFKKYFIDVGLAGGGEAELSYLRSRRINVH